jgi:hypothetical protein
VCNLSFAPGNALHFLFILPQLLPLDELPLLKTLLMREIYLQPNALKGIRSVNRLEGSLFWVLIKSLLICVPLLSQYCWRVEARLIACDSVSVIFSCANYTRFMDLTIELYCLFGFTDMLCF